MDPDIWGTEIAMINLFTAHVNVMLKYHPNNQKGLASEYLNEFMFESITEVLKTDAFL